MSEVIFLICRSHLAKPGHMANLIILLHTLLPDFSVSKVDKTFMSYPPLSVYITEFYYQLTLYNF